MYRNAIIETFKEHCELVALCDNNEGRMRLSNKEILEKGHPEVPTYADADFDSSGVVNAFDLGIFKSLFFQPPGPSGTGTCP